MYGTYLIIMLMECFIIIDWLIVNVAVADISGWWDATPSAPSFLLSDDTVLFINFSQLKVLRKVTLAVIAT